MSNAVDCRRGRAGRTSPGQRGASAGLTFSFSTSPFARSRTDCQCPCPLVPSLVSSHDGDPATVKLLDRGHAHVSHVESLEKRRQQRMTGINHDRPTTFSPLTTFAVPNTMSNGQKHGQRPAMPHALCRCLSPPALILAQTASSLLQ